MLARGYDKLTGNGNGITSLVTGQPSGEYGKLKALNDKGKAEYSAEYGDNPLARVSRFGGNMIATAPIGALLPRLCEPLRP